MKHLSILAEEDDDPMLSAVNLVDVFLVLVVALLTAVALQQQQEQADQTVIKRAGEPDMEIVVRKDGKEIRYKGNGGSSEGQGVRAGVAYKLKDGNIIYVPEGAKP
ncbi:DUF2149 domain-containing protein [Paucibacter soli]|uniref:DUF2149 domain-containing protein n=1 Tax=Paucibacter soli TaxID=3133433 RepID=UPI0030A6DAFD